MPQQSSSDSLRASPLTQLRLLSKKSGIMGFLAVLLVCGQWKPEASDILVPLALDGKGSKVVVARHGTILNRYERISTDLTSGDRVILLSQNDYAVGDLLLVIDNSWTQHEDLTSFEFTRIKAVDCERVTLVHGLMNSYSTEEGTQVIQVPEYQSLRIKAEASITAPAWDGTTGGIIAIATDSLLTVQEGGALSVRGLGESGDGGAIFVLSPEIRGKGRIDASGTSLLSVPYGMEEIDRKGKGHPGRVMVWGEELRDIRIYAEGDGAGMIALPPRALATCFGTGSGIYAQTTTGQWAED